MKFKILSLAVFSALMLSACGGGSSDSSNNTSTSNNSTSSNSSNNNSNNTNTAQQWETVRIDYWYDSHTQAVDFGVLKALLHKDLKCKAPLIELNLRRNLGKWST